MASQGTRPSPRPLREPWKPLSGEDGQGGRDPLGGHCSTSGKDVGADPEGQAPGEGQKEYLCGRQEGRFKAGEQRGCPVDLRVGS